MLRKSILIGLFVPNNNRRTKKSSGRVGKAIVLTCLFTAGYGRHRKLGWGFARPVTAGTGVNGLIFTKILPLHVLPRSPLRVITWLEPTIHSKTYCLVRGQLQKTTHDLDELDMSLQYGYDILVCRYLALTAVN